ILLRITAAHANAVRAEVDASTRPQHFAADHLLRPPLVSLRIWLQRGRSILLRITASASLSNPPESYASTRPQHFAADHACSPRPRSSRRACFNEAAAFCCGSPAVFSAAETAIRRFNEAAAFCCGSPRPGRLRSTAPPASTRPQHFAA